MRFSKYGWQVCENPNGIIFNPNSIYKCIDRYVHNIPVKERELFQHLELWHHWDFHSRFSNIDKETALQEMNASIQQAHDFLKQADWVIITLGSAFQYFEAVEDYGVANCHRVPANRFRKELLEIDDIENDMRAMIYLLHQINPSIQVLFTISPVRHIKDGVVENNISKARLIEAVHRICKDEMALYYPAYEMLIDVLRDYRYYDTDLVHPNFAATQYVWEFLVDHFFDTATQLYLKEMIGIVDAFQHRTRFPQSEAHRKFMQESLDKVIAVAQRFPHWDTQRFIDYFQNKDS